MYRIVYYEEDKADSQQFEIVSAENKTSAARTIAAVRDLMQKAMRNTDKQPFILITKLDDED